MSYDEKMERYIELRGEIQNERGGEKERPLKEEKREIRQEELRIERRKSERGKETGR